ncbi:uncharacterized protein LOC128017300 isoform X2 [Carassius gibelio]|uniref:uncharacterized protein LOC128017300 isoform X2 n=1 Tax=Carassius gibelio TaxID=101364 RepID=UPI00227844AB|nr:uncharacterized protein LOC128017300 isoform X2 [Carassius gibelio]
MNLSATHPLMLFLIGIIFVKQASLTLVKTVNIGTTVTLLCSNILKEPSYIAWFKKTNDSLPLCIATQYIVKVDISDSGIFYCGSFLTNHMMFHDKTQLVVVNETNHSEEDIATVDCGAAEESVRSCHVYYTLTLILSGLVLLSTVLPIVIFIRFKKRNKQKGDAQRHENSDEMNQQLEQAQDADVNYAALSLNKKKNRRPVRRLKDVEPNVVYAATR